MITHSLNSLTLDGLLVLSNMPPEVSFDADPTGAGAFLNVAAWQVEQSLETAASAPSKLLNDSSIFWTLGLPVEARRFLACHRKQPFWMHPTVGSEISQVPCETQFLLIERGDGMFLLIAPLFDDIFRYSIEGAKEGLKIIGESNDLFTPGHGGLAAFISVGSDPYELLSRGTASVAARLQGVGCRLRRDKPLPDFIDMFGWCTWDAFYEKISPQGIRDGLETFAKIGVKPRLLIIDDGWLSVSNNFAGDRKLTSFEPNHKFGGTLLPTVRMAKDEFGVDCVLAWHALLGSWSGVDADRIPRYDVRRTPRTNGLGVLKAAPDSNHLWWGTMLDIPSAERAAQFYDDFHRLLASQGIDGVKVDVQAALESAATGAGGRIALHRAFRAALEGSVGTHFQGRLINCMSHNTETWYLSPDSNLTRFSGDFFPNDPKTHGPHLWTNAAMGLWFGEFQHADWDMFHSLHPHAAFHAAGRAVSGSPVYVSDKPGQHDAEVLRKIVLSDGSVARCRDLGRLSPESLFRDPVADSCLLKIFNHNHHGAVIGVFNTHDEGEAIAGTVSAVDAPGFTAGEHALYAHTTGQIQRDGELPLALPAMGWEVITLAPVNNGLAVIGLAHLLNSGGAITQLAWKGATCHVTLRDGGRLIAWATANPKRILAGGSALTWDFDPASGLLAIEVPSDSLEVEIELEIE